MRKYKATVIVIIMVMLIPFMQSCLDDYDDDIYDMQAGMPFNAALATVVTPSEISGFARYGRRGEKQEPDCGQ